MESKPKASPDKELLKVFEAGGLVEYLEYLQSGKRIMWTNFKAGIAKGLGITIGMSVVLALLIWILAQLVYLPVVGEYFKVAEDFVVDYVEKTNYTDDFAEINRLLQEINEKTKE